MARMRVTLVNRLAGIQRGGGEIYDLSLAVALLRQGTGVEMITGRPFLSPPLPSPAELPVHHVRTPYLRGLSHRLGRPGWRLLDLDLALFERGVEKILASARPRPEIVQVTGMARLARRLETRLGLDVVLLFPGPPSARNRAAIEECATVVGVGAVTPYLRESFRTEVHDMTAGVDSGLFRPGAAPARSRLGIPPGAAVVLYAGRLVPLKNIPLLVRAFASIAGRLDGARLVVVGDGPLRSDLLKEAAAAGVRDRVVLAGEVPHREMPSFYASADILLLTSVNESFSLVALEAMSCGVPVVAPRVGYLPRLVEDGAGGRIYPPGDVEACTRMALEILTDGDVAARASEAARRRALERHSWDAVAREFSDLYRKALSS